MPTFTVFFYSGPPPLSLSAREDVPVLHIPGDGGFVGTKPLLSIPYSDELCLGIGLHVTGECFDTLSIIAALHLGRYVPPVHAAHV
jgi:hypothetical protein